MAAAVRVHDGNAAHYAAHDFAVCKPCPVRRPAGPRSPAGSWFPDHSRPGRSFGVRPGWGLSRGDLSVLTGESRVGGGRRQQHCAEWTTRASASFPSFRWLAGDLTASATAEKACRTGLCAPPAAWVARHSSRVEGAPLFRAARAHFVWAWRRAGVSPSGATSTCSLSAGRKTAAERAVCRWRACGSAPGGPSTRERSSGPRRSEARHSSSARAALAGIELPLDHLIEQLARPRRSRRERSSSRRSRAVASSRTSFRRLRRRRSSSVPASAMWAWWRVDRRGQLLDPLGPRSPRCARSAPSSRSWARAPARRGSRAPSCR